MIRRFRVSYITRFTEESFATLIAIIFVYEAIMKLLKIQESLDVISYVPNGEGALDACRCISTGASVEKVMAIAHKNHWEEIVAHNSTHIDYSSVSAFERHVRKNQRV